jgi:hypothetical protein
MASVKVAHIICSARTLNELERRLLNGRPVRVVSLLLRKLTTLPPDSTRGKGSLLVSRPSAIGLGLQSGRLLPRRGWRLHPYINWLPTQGLVLVARYTNAVYYYLMLMYSMNVERNNAILNASLLLMQGKDVLNDVCRKVSNYVVRA